MARRRKWIVGDTEYVVVEYELEESGRRGKKLWEKRGYGCSDVVESNGLHILSCVRSISFSQKKGEERS